MDRVAWSFRCLLLPVAVAVVLKLVVATSAAPAANLVQSLPGQPNNVTFKQYAGYITVNETAGKRLFYYFVEAENASPTTPLALWLNGGPGCSSLLGAFTELGPFYPNAAANGLDFKNSSWNKVAHVIFLESPVGVGFSYSNTSTPFSDDASTAQDALAFLLGWLAEYPEYSETDFYVTGESYAGHYVPQLAAAIVENNQVPGQPLILLKGVMVGNPLFDAVTDLEYSSLEFVWGHGMMSEDTHNAIVKECNFSSPNRTVACDLAESTANEETQVFSGYINPYDVLADVCLSQGSQAAQLKAMYAKIVPDPCITDELQSYLNSNEVQQALHAEPTSWQQCNTFVYDRTDFDIEISPILFDLVKSELRVWIYSGDLDTVVSLVGTRKILNDLAHSSNWTTVSSYQPWFQGPQVGGWSISWASPSNVSVVYATVRGASHMVPATQLERSLTLFSSFLAGDTGPPLQPPN